MRMTVRGNSPAITQIIIASRDDAVLHPSANGGPRTAHCPILERNPAR